MTVTTARKHILIDFENVPSIDLAPIAGLPVEVTLLVGEKNKQLKVELVAQLLANGSRAHLVKVGASGRNALDLTLAFYLGKAATENPQSEFFIISKDADFDAMLRHLNQHGVRVSRHPSVADLPFVETPARLPQPMPALERLEAYAGKLRNGPAPRDLSALRKKVQNDFKKYIPVDGAEDIIDWLKEAKIVAIDADGKVNVLSDS